MAWIEQVPSKGWKARVYVGTDSKGRERRRAQTFATRKEARRWANRLERELSSGGMMLPDPKLVVEEYFREWLDGRRERIRLTTFLRYDDMIRLHVGPALGAVKLAQLSPAMIQDFYRDLETKGLSSTSALHIHRLLHVALRDAMRQGLIVRNVASPDCVEPPRRRKAERHIWDFEQVRLFLATAKRGATDFESFRNYTLWLFALCTGTRAGEIEGLKWDHVDLGLNLVRIDRQLQRVYAKQVEPEDKVQTCDPKSEHGKRTIPLVPLLAEELLKLKGRQDHLRAELGDRYIDEGYVFTQPHGKPIHMDNIRSRAYRRTIEGVKGLPYIRPHDLRHCCGSFLTALGVDPTTVATILGHADKSFTLRTYTHEVTGVKEAAMKKLDQALFGVSPPSARRGKRGTHEA